jgi:hypothetical protein
MKEAPPDARHHRSDSCRGRARDLDHPGLIGTNVTDVTSLNWQDIGIATAFTTGLSVLTSIVSSGIGEPGTASVMNPAPPDTLK